MSNRYNISIGFSTSRQFISGFIRWITGSSCSHVFIAFDDFALNMRMVMQAESWGFELRPWKRWINNNILVAEFQPASASLDQALFYIAELLGTKFDYRSAILIGVKSTFRKWYHTRFTLNPNKSPAKLTCTEAVIRFLRKGGYVSVKDLDPETTSPGDLLLNVISSRNEFIPLYIHKSYLRYEKFIRKSTDPYSDEEFIFNKEREV